MTEPITDLGENVNNKQLTTDEAVIPIRVPDAIFDRMVKAAQFHKYPNVEAWAAATLVNSLTTKIGAPTIDSPGYMNEQSAAKITGPSFSGMVTRG